MSEEKYPWPLTTSELAEILGIKEATIRQHRYQKRKEFKYGQGEDCWDNAVAYSNAKDPRNIVWSKSGAVKMARFCRSRKAGIFLESVGALKRHRSSIESDSLDIIEDSLQSVTKCIRQFPVGPWGTYRIDLYLPDLKIAVECDENAHEGRDGFDEQFRQQEIEEKLQCQFIRFNPDETNFNIGKVINRIFLAITNRHEKT